MASSGNQPMHSSKPTSSLSSTLSFNTSQSSSESSMPDTFSPSTRLCIRTVCHGRCVICLRRVGSRGQCAHILDSADEGRKMVTYGSAVGVLAPNYSRSAVGNGIVLCSSCHQDLYTPKDTILSPPRQVLEYLVALVRAGSSRPIHEVLHSLICSAPPYPDSSILDPHSILPFLGIYTLVALDPERLQNVEFHIYMEPEVSELRDGHWTTIALPNATPSSQITARIHDATSLLPTDHNQGCDIQLARMPDNEQRYWRLPTEIGPILTYLLYSVCNLGETNIEELRLAIELHGLLNCVKNNAPSRGPDVSGGSPDVGSKRGHDGGPGSSRARKRGRLSLLQKGACGSGQAGVPSGKLRFSADMTSYEIIFAARGIILY